MNKNIYCYKDDWDEIINQIKIISFTKNSAKIIGNTPEKKSTILFNHEVKGFN